MFARIQLTLFIPESDSEVIEQIRSVYNPEQYALIRSHVTLCREDELEQIEQVLLNLENLSGCFTIAFGDVIRFSEGRGVLIPALENNEAFQQLRAKVLHGIIEQPRIHNPHITLMHPRNATCTDEIFDLIQKRIFPRTITFRKISLIEQENGMKWNILKEFDLEI